MEPNRRDKMEKRIASVETLPPVIAALFFVALSVVTAHFTYAWFISML